MCLTLKIKKKFLLKVLTFNSLAVQQNSLLLKMLNVNSSPFKESLRLCAFICALIHILPV